MRQLRPCVDAAKGCTAPPRSRPPAASVRFRPAAATGESHFESRDEVPLAAGPVGCLTEKGRFCCPSMRSGRPRVVTHR